MPHKITAVSLGDEILDNQDVERCFRELLRGYGVRHVQYKAINPGRSPERVAIGTFPSDWCKRYLERGYWKVDPIHQYALGKRVPCLWESMTSLSPQQDAFMMEVADRIGSNGITVPILEPPILGSISIIAKEGDTRWKENLPRLIWKATTVGQRIHREVLKHISDDGSWSVRLNDSQAMCLNLMADGMTEDAIAAVTRMSRQKVKRQLDNIGKKFNSKNPSQIITKAALMRVRTA